LPAFSPFEFRLFLQQGLPPGGTGKQGIIARLHNNPVLGTASTNHPNLVAALPVNRIIAIVARPVDVKSKMLDLLPTVQSLGFCSLPLIE
jgi:hypothetical protein